jgi:hypothetical protein
MTELSPEGGNPGAEGASGKGSSLRSLARSANCANDRADGDILSQILTIKREEPFGPPKRLKLQLQFT